MEARNFSGPVRNVVQWAVAVIIGKYLAYRRLVISDRSSYLKLLSSTMLQKLSKHEVKAARFGNFTICLPLRFYVKSKFGEI